jgi:hypothetical protein
VRDDNGFAGSSGDGEMGSKSNRTVELEAANRGAAAASKWTPSDTAERQHNRRKPQLLCTICCSGTNNTAKSQDETVWTVVVCNEYRETNSES